MLRLEKKQSINFLLENWYSLKSLPKELWQLTQIVVGLVPLIGMINHIYTGLSYLISKPDMAFTEYAASSTAISYPFIKVPLPEPLAEIIIACVVTGVLTYLVLKKVCESEWVQEPVSVRKCWEEVKWYNPFSWGKALVCTVKEVLKWVLKRVCGYVEEVVTALVIACIVTAIIIII